MRLVWSERLRTGIREIDLQHQGFIDIINDLEDFCHESPARGSQARGRDLDRILAQLVAYAEFHFATEDALMGRHLPESSPHLLVHARAHAGFGQHIQAFRRRPEGERLAAAGQLLDHLKRWLEQHILGVDKKLVELIEARHDHA